MIRWFVLFVMLIISVPSSEAADRYGYLGRAFLAWPVQTQDTYVTGVLDTVATIGVVCPAVPTYAEIIARTEQKLRNNPDLQGKWAALTVIMVLGDLGCRVPGYEPAA